MLDKLFNKPLEIKIGEQTLQFNSVSDIAFCLEGRTSISSTKLVELYQLSTSDLEEQAQKLSSVNKSMFEILNKIVDEPEGIDRSMRELDTQMFSQDQNWRDIIQALNKAENVDDKIRVTVIMKYMKYLSAIEETVNYIHSERKRSDGAAAAANEPMMNDFEATWAIGQLRNEVRAAEQVEKDDGLTRLPKDTQVSVPIKPGRRFELRLATYPCQLAANDNSVQFISDSGATVLNKGRNIIGRSVKSTVQIDSEQRHVSRSHLVIDINEANTLKLTDVSSEGTFITSNALA